MAGALAGFSRKIPIGHTEAGLRSGNLNSPFPAEMNSRLVSNISSFHFAATEKNRHNLLSENISDGNIFVTGNPVVDAHHSISKTLKPSRKIQQLIEETEGKKRILLTTHRRFKQATAARLSRLPILTKSLPKRLPNHLARRRLMITKL